MHGRDVQWYTPPDALRYPPWTPLSVRCAALGTGQGVDALCREWVRLPALAAVLGAKHLAPARRTVYPLGRLRAGSDDHQGAVDADVVVKAPPGRSQISAAIERAGVTHRGKAKRAEEGLRVVRENLDIARIGQGREASDLHIGPALALVIATKQAQAVGQKHRRGLRRADGQGMCVHHAFTGPAGAVRLCG